MYLAHGGIIQPKEWHHDPKLKNKYNNTVAMRLAEKEIIPPEEWYHNPEL